MPLSWNASGLIAPIAPNELPTGQNRSPYKITLVEAMDFFADTKERRNLFRDFLRYRKALHGVGICNGFQWINGSFVEQVETIRNRPPGDIDVVTFTHLPNDCQNQHDLFRKNPDLFDPKKTKVNFRVDGYTVFLGSAMMAKDVRDVSYWYSLWSHQRETYAWKGFIQLDLASGEDESVEEILNNEIEEVAP